VDVSIEALNKARQACYGTGAFRGHMGEDVARYFQETPHGRKVADQVIEKVAFHHDNLVMPGCLDGRGPYEIIFCRNLLIYLTPEARRKVFERLDSLLLPGGLLFTGHTETIFWHQQGYLPRKWDRAFALTKPALQPLQKKAAATTAPNTRHQDAKIAVKPGPAAGSKPQNEANGEDSSTGLTDRKQPVRPARENEEPSPDERILEARRLADRGDMDGAVSLCQEHIRKTGPSAEAYCLMGVIRMARQDMNSALDFFLKSIYLDPGHYESLIHISLIYREKGDKQKEALYRERAERKAGTEAKKMETSQAPSMTENIRRRTTNG
jgi:chemotaxis protein methyltransferase WspC